VAQDAGASGQILEESDLTDAAVAERLRTELHARVLATRLLQRYGFLVPRLNPDSELDAEQKLVRQERAQILARAAERRDNLGESSPSVTSTACDPARSAGCAQQPALPPQRTEEMQQTEASGPEGTSLPPNQPSEYRASLGSAENTPGSGRGRTSSQPTRAPSVRGNGNLDPLSTPLSAQPDSETLALSQQQAAEPSRAQQPGRNATPTRSGAGEPERMVRQRNPYANVPSLYDLYVQAAPSTRQMERFGLDVFRKGEANPLYLPMDLPVGPTYVVGPGDTLSINIWGGLSQRILRIVDREGRVELPDAGPLLVSGRTLGDVQQEVQRVLRTQYRNVSADVSLVKLRTVRVYVVGEVASPGAYDVSSLSTPINALFAAGGVTPQGSLRTLQHYRGKTLVEEVDTYDLLLHGVRGDLERLENGDSLLVPPLGSVVKVDGMVRRPALYELHGEKTLEDALDLAGGILPAAALRHIEVQRLVAHEKRTMWSVEMGETSDPEAIRSKLRGFAVQDGDEIHIFPIAPYNSGSIYLEGHVLRPGRYSYKPEMKLTDLVNSYADLLPEPSVRYAEIIRLQAPDYHPVVESFDLAAALEHPETAPKLEPLDTVRIFGRYDFEPDPEVLVTGEVRAPGQYRASGQQHVRDAIFQAGGVTSDAWLDAAQLFRRQTDGTTRVFSLNLRDVFTGDPLNNILVLPRDRIIVHRQPEQISQASVYVRGDVARPGRYPLAANMRVSDLVQSAGGLLRSANPDAADLTHYSIPRKLPGESAPAGHLDVSLSAALAGKEEQNLPLSDGDVLTVPQVSGWNDIGATVTLRGEVRKPGVYGIRPGERLSSLMKRAGGLLPTAYPRASIFERTEVRELQQKSRQDLIQRLEQESTVVKTSAATTGGEEAALQQAAIQQRQRVIDGLRKAPISGRLVIRLRPERKGFEGSTDDIELRTGDSLVIPKQPGAVLVIGQVYNSNALTYRPGRKASWYLARAGGPTQLANKGGIFIIRSDGSVSGNERSFWAGGVLNTTLGPGDTIVVPERPILGSNTLRNILSVAQIASSAALVAAVAIP